jgi:hypothetical protein
LYRGITFILYLRIKAFLGQKPRAGDEIIEWTREWGKQWD